MQQHSLREVKIDGVDVSGLKTEAAVKKIMNTNNSFTIEKKRDKSLRR